MRILQAESLEEHNKNMKKANRYISPCLCICKTGNTTFRHFNPVASKKYGLKLVTPIKEIEKYY